MHRRFLSVLAVTLLATGFSSVASAAPIYSDDFNTDTSANYNVFVTPGSNSLPSGDATFAYDYGAAPGSGGLSIPPAPHTTDGSTLGLRVRTDNLQSSSGTVVGATEVATKNGSLPSKYRVQVDVWDNYIGNGTSISSSGSNGTTAAGIGIGTAGTSLQYIVSNDGLFVESFGDNGGGTNQAYRVYTNGTHPNPTTKPYWAAGTSGTSASFSDPYYVSAFPSVSAPAGQSSFLATQSGNTAAGTLGFAWHTWTFTNDSQNVVWAIDGTTIATIPTADFTTAGGQISLNAEDTGLAGNSAANNQLLNAHIFDNLTITEIPEPASVGLLLLGLAGFGLAARRERRGV